VSAIREKVNISERRACRLVGLSRSVLHYDAKPEHENEVLAARLVELAHERRRFGYRRPLRTLTMQVHILPLASMKLPC